MNWSTDCQAEEAINQGFEYELNHIGLETDSKLLVALSGKFGLCSRIMAKASFVDKLEEELNLHKSLSSGQQPSDDPVRSLLDESALRILINESNCHFITSVFLPTCSVLGVLR